MMKLFPVQTKKKMQNGVQNAAGVAGRQHGAGFDGNDDKPQDRCEPRLQKILLVRIQERGLLDAIIRSLACDHNVVNVALAQAGTADAHEACFLK